MTNPINNEVNEKGLYIETLTIKFKKNNTDTANAITDILEHVKDGYYDTIKMVEDGKELRPLVYQEDSIVELLEYRDTTKLRLSNTTASSISFSGNGDCISIAMIFAEKYANSFITYADRFGSKYRIVFKALHIVQGITRNGKVKLEAHRDIFIIHNINRNTCIFVYGDDSHDTLTPPDKPEPDHDSKVN